MQQNTISVKQNLAYAYRIIGKLGLDDHTYTHLSARAPNKRDTLFMHQFGLRFSEVTAQNLLEVTFNGDIKSGTEKFPNTTGYALHGAFYKLRSDVMSIFHIHTPNIVAVSAMKCGLLPISQWALHFYNKVRYYEYGSLVLDDVQGAKMAESIEDANILMLRNHGVVICARTIPEAMFFLHHLEQACHTQCLALASNQELVLPTKEIAELAVSDLLSFEKNLGERDFQAWIRML